MFSQPPQAPGEPLVAPTSAQTSEFSHLCQEKFTGITQKIGNVRWWGLALHYDGQQWVPCYPFTLRFEIVFYRDDNGIPGAPVFTFTDVAPSITSTGLSFEGMSLYQFEVEQLAPCAVIESGWISIQSLENPYDCAFLWVRSPVGEFNALQNGESLNTNLAYCLAPGDCPDVFGACCNELAGTCTEDVEWSECIGADERFMPDALCADLQPPCGQIMGACCQTNGNCEITTYAECDAMVGVWLGPDSTCDECPSYCQAGAYNCSEYVQRVELGTIDNETGCGLGSGGTAGYSDYTDISTEVEVGTEYLITVTNGSLSQPADACGIWLDWNNNFRFDDESEAVEMSGSPGVGPYTAIITPPAYASGMVRMRVRVDFYGPGACGWAYFGGVEDYMLQVEPRACPGDLDGDNDTDISDLAELLANYGTTSGASYENGDIDGDGDVDRADLASLLGVYGTVCN